MSDYAIYLRKSRADLEAEQHGEGETLERHRTALRALAERRGLNVVREYAELVTGDSIAARPQMQLLLDDVKKGMYAGVIVNDVDRLGRGDSIDQEIIKYAFMAGHCLIITPMRDINPESPSDEDMLDFGMFFARFEYRKIAQRLMQGRIRSAEAGNYIHSRIPFGYKQVKDGRRITLEPDPATAPIVRMMFEEYASKNIGYHALATKLNDMGIRTTRGYAFYPNTVRQILTNPVYIGTNRWGQTKTVVTIENGKKVKRPVTTHGAIVIEDAHPAIVSKETFYRVQKVLSESARVPRTNATKPLTNPFAGLLRCSVCGKIMMRASAKRGTSLLCPTYGCPTVGAPVYVIEEAVLETLRGWCAEYEELPDVPEDNPEKEEALRQRANALDRRLEKARELVELGIYSPAEYVEQRNIIRRQLDALHKEMAENAYTPVANAIHDMLPQIRSVIDAYKYAGNASEKNALLKTIIQKIDYEKTVKARGKESPAKHLKLVIYPRLCL